MPKGSSGRQAKKGIDLRHGTNGNYHNGLPFLNRLNARTPWRWKASCLNSNEVNTLQYHPDQILPHVSYYRDFSYWVSSYQTWFICTRIPLVPCREDLREGNQTSGAHHYKCESIHGLKRKLTMSAQSEEILLKKVELSYHVCTQSIAFHFSSISVLWWLIYLTVALHCQTCKCCHD